MATDPSNSSSILPGRQPLRRRAAIGGLLCAALAWAPACADGKKDQDRARAAVQSGEIMPLPALLARLQASRPGQVMELELELEDGRWIYEIKLLQANGQLLKLEVDAATGQVLKLKRKGGSRGQPHDAGAAGQ